MTGTDKSFWSILGGLGFRSSRVGKRGMGSADKREGAESAIQQSRRDCMDQIASFLLSHELDITGDNLLAAYGIISGSNPALSRQLAQRVAEGLPITQAWLDETTAVQASKDKHDGIQHLMARLEAALETFANNATAARSATSAYGGELERQVAELGQVQKTGSIIASLADLAKAMLERTRQLETDMRTSEDEAKALRHNLEKAKRDAEIDHLTGLPNRRAFEAVLDREYREARVCLDPLVVAFCDIDNFKQINDTHGHEAGDRVIRLIADMLETISTDHCHVARHGGEEFVILVRGSSVGEAQLMLDGLREQLADRRLINRQTDQPFGKITFSAGLADVFDFSDARAALRAADEALYAAKKHGRNRVSIAPKPKGA